MLTHERSARLEVPYEDLERAKTEAREVARSQVIAAASQQLNREHALVRWLSGMVQSLVRSVRPH